MIMLLVFGFFFIACKESKPKELSADEIVNKAIEKAGGEKYNNLDFSFKFRDKEYFVKRKDGLFEYSRVQLDSLNRKIIDKLDNNGLVRTIDGEVQKLEKKKSDAYAESVNSVVYFALLPHGLNDKAVNKTLLGVTEIGDNQYFKIKVTFAKEGGGTDYEDEYIYYIDNQQYKVSYLSYNFKVNDGGSRFRKAVNERVSNGIRFVDYLNYKPKIKTLDIQDFDQKFQNGELELVSRIKMENIQFYE